MDSMVDKDEVRKVVKEDLTKVVEEQLLKKEKRYGGIYLIERVARVEQALENINKRIEDFMHYVDKKI